MALTEKQKRFIEELIKTGNKTQAALNAGYSAKTAKSIGSENLTKPDLLKAYKRRLAEIEEQQTATPEEVMKFLTSSMRGEIKEDVVVTEGVGEGCSNARVMKKQIGAKDRLKAAELLLKRYPMASEEEERKLRMAKLKAEVNAMQEDDTENVVIIDDVPDEEEHIHEE